MVDENQENYDNLSADPIFIINHMIDNNKIEQSSEEIKNKKAEMEFLSNSLSLTTIDKSKIEENLISIEDNSNSDYDDETIIDDVYNELILKDVIHTEIKLPEDNVNDYTSSCELKVNINEDDFLILEDSPEKLKLQNNILRQLLKNLRADMKTKDAYYLENIKNYDVIYKHMMAFKSLYENTINMNLNLNKEILKLKEEIMKLKDKLSVMNDPSYNRREILKAFQEEYKILENEISSDWEIKYNKLEKTLKTEIEVKMQLLGESLNHQYIANTSILNRYIDICNININAINLINDFLNNIVDTKPFMEYNWKKVYNNVQQALNDNEIRYKQALRKLNSNSIEKFRIKKIYLVLPSIQHVHVQNIKSTIQDTLKIFEIIYNNFTVYVNNLGHEFDKLKFSENIQLLILNLVNKSSFKDDKEMDQQMDSLLHDPDLTNNQ